TATLCAWGGGNRSAGDGRRRDFFIEVPQMTGGGMPSTKIHQPPAAVPQQAKASISPEHSYYDLSPLKPPVWKWQIAAYFFLGGMSAGALILARLAERFGGGKSFQQITRFGTYAAIAAAAPCPLFLIDDLGDKSRFHHMLRVWKPTSPMNLGTW